MEIVGLAVLLGGGWYWFAAMRAKELAREAGRSRCAQAGLIFLDDTVVLKGLRLRRDPDGRLAARRRFGFEFTAGGEVRYGGEIVLMGGRVVSVVMDPYREDGL